MCFEAMSCWSSQGEHECGEPLGEYDGGACTMFGSFVKFVVEIPETSADQNTSRISILPNAFSVMMAAQRSLKALDRSGFPQTKENLKHMHSLFKKVFMLPG